MAKIEIIPAILPADFAEVREKVELVAGFVKTVQIDVCDGQFTPQPTWPYKKHDDTFEKIVKEEEGLPNWQEVNFEIDLMANKPEQLVEQWVTAGATRIIVHRESKGDPIKALDLLKGRVEVGLSFNINTPEDIFEIEHSGFTVDFVQFMGIDHIGFQGQPFDGKVLDLIKEFKEAYPTIPVSVDGAVSLETAPQLIAAGADRLVIGSAIFNAENYVEALDAFKALAR